MRHGLGVRSGQEETHHSSIYAAAADGALHPKRLEKEAAHIDDFAAHLRHTQTFLPNKCGAGLAFEIGTIAQ